MKEIEKLYKNAEIEKIYGCSTCPYVDCEDRCKVDMETNYPYFTAEKQIELIKWLCKKTYRNYLLIRYNFTNYFWQIECNMTDSDKLDNFAETITSMINNLWQDLTEKEKQQVKGILK